MKTKLTILLLITIAAVSCTKEVIETRGGNEAGIGFTTLGTRGNMIAGALDVAQAGGFNVWGYRYAGYWPAATKTLLFNNVTVTSADNGATWSYGSPIDWPIGQKVSFFAYAPASGATAVGSDVNGIPIIDFTVDNNPANQKDFLIANQMLDRTGPSPVNVHFEHALSHIRFSALKAASVTEDIRITNIELKNLYFSGTTTLQTPVAWTVNTTAVKNYSVASSSGGLQNVALTTSTQLISLPAGILFLMPQALQRASDAPEMVVSFTADGVPLSYSCPLFSPAEWKPGKTYTYQLAVNDTHIVLILCGELESTTVGSWGDY